jgi:ketosteroid isomerase-like protein
MTDMPNEPTQRVFKTIDSMQPDSIAALFTEDARMVFGNADPLVGREAITAGVQGFFSTINGLQHQIVNEWHIGADTIAETEVTYRRLDDKKVTVPVVSIWHTHDGLIDDYRVFFDLTPVYTP